MGIPYDISEDKWLNKGGWEVRVLDKKKMTRKFTFYKG